MTTWRLRQTIGSGWVEHIDADGSVSVTGMAEQARQWPDRESALEAAGRMRPGLVPVEPVEGRAFEGRSHGEP